MRTLVVGAGLAGLSCAAAVRSGCRVVEREERPGGLCRTGKWGGFTVDLTGHYLHFRDPEVKKAVFRLLGGNLAARPRDSWVRVGGLLTPYPFQGNLFGHPPRVIHECLAGLLKARSVKSARPARTYEEWIVRTFGEGFARHFLFPFNRKQFLVPLSRLTPLQAGRFVPRPSLDEVVRGAMTPDAGRGFGYNAMLWHPKRGGIEALPGALARKVKVECGRKVARVDWRGRAAVMADGEAIQYDTLVSTAPLPELLGMLSSVPAAIVRARRELRAIGVVCVNLLVRRPRERARHWIYIPGPEACFYRVGFPSNINPSDAPPGMGIISAEVSYRQGRRPALAVVAARVRRDLAKLGLLGGGVVRAMTFDIPYAYVLFTPGSGPARRAALGFLARQNILSIGRYGGWVYGGMEDALREGMDTGTLIRSYGSRASARFRAGRE